MIDLRVWPTPIHVRKSNFQNKILQCPKHGFSDPGPTSAQEQAVGERYTSHERNSEKKWYFATAGRAYFGRKFVLVI